MKDYPYLYLTDWPFRIVPDEEFCTFMADRVKLKEDLNSLLRNLSRRNNSTIHLMWAWFGAGKTHTLLHMSYLCRMQFKNLYPIYMEFPKAVKSFLDLYRNFISSLDFEIITNSYMEVATSLSKDKIKADLEHLSTDLSHAIEFLASGSNNEKDIIQRWLRGDKLDLRLLQGFGITRRVDTSEEAIKVISWVIKLLNYGSELTGSVNRIIWVIDEFQRIENCRKLLLDEINSCLHSTFNRNPNCFSLIFSFSGTPHKKLPEWFSPELEDRIGIEKVLVLPPMTSEEAFLFIKDLLVHFRPIGPGVNLPNPYFPFTEESINYLIDLIKKSKNELKPRLLMQFFNAVMEDADPLIEQKKLNYITQGFIDKALEDRNFEQ